MERLVIKGAKSIAQYKILQWVNENFIMDRIHVTFWEDRRAVIYDEYDDRIFVKYDKELGVVEENDIFE